jgi:hypothetical protein
MSNFEEAYPSQGEFQDQPPLPAPTKNRWWLGLTLVLFAATGASAIYAIRQNRAAQQLAQVNSQITDSLRQTQAQLASLNEQVTALKAELYSQPPATPSEASVTSEASSVREGSARGKIAAAHRAHQRALRHADLSRFALVQHRLSEQQQQIDATQQAIAQTRSDLQSSLSSTRDDLNNAIAHNHAELVALERKGERNYYEFNIPKAKQFQREGPLSISLRHTNTKHKNYNLVVLVDDTQITKKNVNLYEPLVFQTGDGQQPLEIVVNRIDKNRVAGYVSAPKYSALEASASVEAGSVAAGQQSSANSGAAPSSGTPASSPSLHHRSGTD